MIPNPDETNRRYLTLHLRASRRKARTAAVAETLSLLSGLDVIAASGGPLADQPGVAWITVAEPHLDAAIGRLRNIGYVDSIDLVLPTAEHSTHDSARMRWKGREIVLRRVYEVPDESLRARAPDRRTFLLECGDGVVRPIQGYRGGRGAFERRALPVEDARLLVNLAALDGPLLDPFAGAGGIIVEARERELETASVDIDFSLRFGLAAISHRHVVGDARHLPFADASFGAIATEPPYHPQTLEVLVRAVGEMARVMRRGGRIAMLVAARQADASRDAARRAKLALEHDFEIDRKGTAVTCLCWRR